MNAIELRHLIHENPELAFEEYKTQELIEKATKEIGLNPLKVAKTGLIVPIENYPEKPYLVLRADMDALPIKEKTGWKYASKNDYMHACGHDVHVSIMYEVMKKVVTERLKDNFLFIFQPAEESGGGASHVLESMKEFRVKGAIAMHVTDEYRFGTVATRSGILFASATEINLVFKGRAAHIAAYKEGIDALKTANIFLEKFYGTSFEASGLVGIGKAYGGNARNIVADTFIIEGTIRSDSLDKSKNMISKLSSLAQEACKKTGADFSLTTGSIYPQVEVDHDMFKSFETFVKKSKFKFETCDMKYTGEDFGFFTLVYPSLMFWAGTRMSDEKIGLHNPLFLPEDRIIPELSQLIFSYIHSIITTS
jgi:N-acetyldiaminopimelate deacetylase